VPNNHYRRFTDLPSLIQILSNRELTLLDPATWDDKNDSFFLSTYKQKKNLKSVLALCFTSSRETYHHWKVFSSGPAGVCIHFERAKLDAAFEKVPGVKFKEVAYLKISSLNKEASLIDGLPFVKRYPFRPEHEHRALWESDSESKDYLNVEIDLSSITRISLSPWLHRSLKDNIVSLLRGIEGCAHIDIQRSTIVGNAEWRRFGKRAQ